MDFKAKVYLFYYMWIWQLIDFLDLDGIKRIQLVEDNKNFLYVPNRVSEVLFADWLQNKVLPKIESKFILQVNYLIIILTPTQNIDTQNIVQNIDDPKYRDELPKISKNF